MQRLTVQNSDGSTVLAASVARSVAERSSIASLTVTLTKVVTHLTQTQHTIMQYVSCASQAAGSQVHTNKINAQLIQ